MSRCDWCHEFLEIQHTSLCVCDDCLSQQEQEQWEALAGIAPEESPRCCWCGINKASQKHHGLCKACDRAGEESRSY